MTLTGSFDVAVSIDEYLALRVLYDFRQGALTEEEAIFLLQLVPLCLGEAVALELL